MTFRRVLRADVVAMVAALALLLVMATDWYSTTLGNDARQIQKISTPEKGTVAAEAENRRRSDARFLAQSQEKNAWQVNGGIDRLILVLLLATILLAVAAAWLRAAGRRFEPPGTPSTAAAALATLTGVLVVYRIIQEPGDDSITVIKAGAPIAVAVLAVIALACRQAMRAEEDGSAWPEPEPAQGPEPAP